MAIGFQGMMTPSKCKQICISIPTSFQHQQKTRHPKLTNFKKILNYKTSRVFRGFEQLSGSISRRVMAIDMVHQGSAFVCIEFLPIFAFWDIILDPDVLES